MDKKKKFLIQTIHTSFLLLFCFVFPALAEEFQVGQSVILQATKPKGVPMHREPSPSFWKHVPNDSVATIKQIAKNGKWFSVLLESGETGWVVPKYLRSHAQPLNPIESLTDPVSEERLVWSSPDQCEQVVNSGKRMPTVPSTLRLATWNIRWFPDGHPEKQADNLAHPTDLAWLVCTIIWMQVDILAVQESLATPEARRGWDFITQSLQQKSHDSWRWTRQRCGRQDDHHIGLLWNADRISLSHFDSLWHFNAKAKSAKNPCANGLRPGLYAWAQSRKKNGADFHLIALHLKSGPTVLAVEERHKALNRLDQAIAPLLAEDQDVMILGDFNTMGAGDWKSRDYELKNVRRMVAKEKPGFKDVSLTPQCSHYFRGRGGWLDHVLVTKAMKEITVNSAHVTGYCAVSDCERIRGDYPLAYRHLSDHCPVIIEVMNRDED